MIAVPDPSADLFNRSESDLLVFISSVMKPELKWAREAAVRTFKSFHFAQPWAFEFTPASSETPDDAYLRKARDTDFMVWLVGSRTSQAVVREVNARMATGRRLLVFQLPTPSRHAATSQLLSTVSTYCKWHAVGSAAALPGVLKASISDEISRALRDPLDLADRRRCNDGVTRPSLGASSCGLHWAYPPGSPPSWLATDPSATSLPSPLRAFSWSLALSAPASPWPLSASFSTRSNAHSQTQANPFRRVPLEEHVEGRTAGLVQPRHQPTLTWIMHEEPILGETQEPPCGTNVVPTTF